MRTKILALLVLLGGLLKAQFNKTYDVNGNTDYVYPSFVIPTSDLGSAILSWCADLPSGPRTDYFIVTRLDYAGNVVFNTRINPQTSGNDGYVFTKAMVETDDKGFLVGGFYYTDLYSPIQPVLIKLDSFGNYQWTIFYPVSANFYNGFQFDKVSLIRVYDDPDENYFLVSSVDSDLRSNDAAISVIKVDSQGKLIWSKKYYDSNLLTGPYTNVWDCPGDIAYSKIDGMYMIVGWRQDWIYWTEAHKTFFMGIDRNGNVITPYKTLTASGYPFGHDMIYDPVTQNFVATFTHGNTYLTPGGAVSGIGLLRLDAALTVNLSRIYWTASCGENYGQSISLCAGGDYAIGALEFCPVRNPGLLKVDNTGAPLFFKRYNTGDNIAYGHHCTSINPFSGKDEYILAQEQNFDMRAIRTDLYGDACGAYDDVAEVTDHTPVEDLFVYHPEDIGTEKRTQTSPVYYWPGERDCTYPGTSYKTSAITGINTGEPGDAIRIYPSQLPAGAAVLQFEGDVAGLAVNVMDAAGRVVYQGSLPITGRLSLSDNGSLSPGIYLVKYHGTNGNINGCKKIIVTP